MPKIYIKKIKGKQITKVGSERELTCISVMQHFWPVLVDVTLILLANSAGSISRYRTWWYENEMKSNITKTWGFQRCFLHWRQLCPCSHCCVLESLGLCKRWVTVSGPSSLLRTLEFVPLICRIFKFEVDDLVFSY